MIRELLAYYSRQIIGSLRNCQNILYLSCMEEPTEPKIIKEPHKRRLLYESDAGHPWESRPSEEQERIYESSTQILEKRKARRLEEAAEFLYGKSLKWYKEVVIWPMFILLLVELGVRVIQTKYLFLWPPQVFNWVITAARIILFSYLAAIGIKHFKANKIQIVVAAIIGGGVVGFLLAIFQLFWYFELWTFFNLIGQPLLLMAEGMLISWLVYSLFFNKKDVN